MQHIKIMTQFDITHTNVVRNLKKELLPTKINGRLISTEEEWFKARRQQSNWETFMQILSLRTQPLNIKSYKKEDQWVLEFDIEFDGMFARGDDELRLLKDDCEHVPMVVGLDERGDPGTVITIDGNTKFEVRNSDRI